MKQRGSFVFLIFGVAAAYFCAATLGLSLAVVHPSASAIWAPAGIALAALLVWGLRLWPAVFVASFLADLTAAGSVPAVLAIATGATLEAVVGTLVIRRFAQGIRAFESPRSIARFVLWCGPSVLVSATIGVTALCLDGAARWDHFAAIWSTWWLGDLFGALIFTPFLVLWLTRPLPQLSRPRVIEAIELLVALVLLGQILFLGTLSPGTAQFKYLTILPLIWAALRFGQRGAMTAVMVVAFISLWGVAHGVGPFAVYDPDENLLLMQAFLGCMAIVALLLSAVISGRQRAEQRLLTRDAVSRTLAESSTLEEAASKIAQALCENNEWDMGAVWLIDRTANQLYCVDLWCSDGERFSTLVAATRQARYAEGVGLPGRVWSAGTPMWLSTMTLEPGLPRAPLALSDGLKGAFCLPIKRGRDVLGVVECYSRQAREPASDLLELFDYIGSQLGQFIVRTQAEAAHAELLRREREARISAESARMEVERQLAERRQVEEALGRWAREPAPEERRTAAWRYGVPLISVACVLLLQWAIDDFMGDRLALTSLLGAVAIAVWYGGMGPGLVACAMGYTLVNWRMVPELGRLGATDLIGFEVYLVTCLAVMAVGNGMRRSERHARSSARLAVTRQSMVEAEMAAREEAQTSLRAAEAQLRLITERTPLMLTRCSRDLRYLYVNRAGARMFGLSPQEMIGKSIVEIIGVGAMAIIRPHIERVLSGQTIGFEAELPYTRTGVRAVRVVYVPDTDERGAVIGWVASVDDVTDRYRAEKARRQSDERTRRIVETAMDAVVSVNVQGAITDWNPQAEQIFGWKETEVIGRSLSETIIPPRHRKDLEVGLQRYGKSGASPLLGRRMEIVARRRDRGEIPVELSVTSTITGDQTFFHAFIRDITERKRAEQQLQDRECIQRLLEEIGALAVRTAVERTPFGELFQAICGKIAGELDVFRCGFSRIDLAAGRIAVEADFCRDGPSLRGTFALIDDSGPFVEDGANGRMTIMEDLTADPRAAATFRRFYEPLGARSCMVAPCHHQGRWVGNVWVSCQEARRWTQGEVELLRTVAERVWTLAEEARAGEELRQITADLQAAHAELLKHAGELEEKVRERTVELSEANTRLQNALVDRLQLDASREQLRRRFAGAHEEERRRIARELHDQMGQRVIALSLGLKSLNDAAAGHETITRLLPALQDLASQTGQDLHRVALELRQPALDDLGLTSAIQSHVRTWSRNTGVAADFQQHGYEDSKIPEAVETTLYRFVQEALNNVAKHAEASQVSVILEHNVGGTQAIVEDNGRGFDVETTLRVSMPHGQLGLLGMRERLLLVGGTLSIESTSRGTTLFARIPSRRQDEKESQNSHSSR